MANWNSAWRKKWNEPLTYEETCRLNDSLQKLNKKAAANSLIPKFNGNWRKRRGPLFHKHPPEVREKALECLNTLLIKHKAKLESLEPKRRRRYYSLLCGTAVSMAVYALGIKDKYATSRKATGTQRFRNTVKRKLYRATASLDPTPTQVSYANTEGV